MNTSNNTTFSDSVEFEKTYDKQKKITLPDGEHFRNDLWSLNHWRKVGSHFDTRDIWWLKMQLVRWKENTHGRATFLSDGPQTDSTPTAAGHNNILVWKAHQKNISKDTSRFRESGHLPRPGLSQSWRIFFGTCMFPRVCVYVLCVYVYSYVYTCM